MSGSQRMRKSSPCSTTKQGPMRATLPVSSLLRQSRQGSSLRKSNSNSPTVSPTNANAWRASRNSPETSSSSSGQRSPGSLSYKAKSKTLSGRCSDGLSGSQNIRRTASLDTIYLKGQWPRESYYIHTSLLLVDKSTQTEEWSSSEPRKLMARHPPEQNTTTDEKLKDKYIRQRLQRNKESTSSRTAAFGLIMPGGPPPALPGDHTVLLPSIASQTSMHNQFNLSTKASPMNIPVKPMRPPMRSSIEGLNQEIEGLVLKSAVNTNDPDHSTEDKMWCKEASTDPEESSSHSRSLNSPQNYAKYREQMTPEGHRAPLADLLRATRSVNTQTPATDLPSSSYSSGPPSRNSESPLIPGVMDTSRPPSDLPQGGSRGSTPEQEREGRLGTSPHINRFLAREPPDGCEKVNLKFVEDARRPMIDLSKLDYCPKPCVAFQLKPSLGSAFLPLQQPASPTMIAAAASMSASSHATSATPPPNP